MKKLLILLLLATMMYSCKKDVSYCVQRKINDFSKSRYCEGGSVKEYIFQGEKVYAFAPKGCCSDCTTEVINSHCTTLGYLGGFMPNYKINGEDFSNAKYVKTHWEN